MFGAQNRRNACPGLSRMVMARDGAIARIKLPLGRISSAAALALADVAEQFGANAVEISIRANMQLRGIAPENWHKAVTTLYDASLGAHDPAADDIRNVMVSPTAGIDRGQLRDVTPLARQLLAMLEATPDFHALSPKFSFQIDGGEHCAMVSHPGDIWLSATGDGRYAFGLASAPDGPALGFVAAENALPFIEALLHLFLARAQNGVTRMRQLFENLPPALFLRELAATLPFPLDPAKDWVRQSPEPFAHLGIRKQANGRWHIGVMPMLGRLGAAQLRALATIAMQANGGEIRLTPWQGVLLPDVPQDRCGDVARQLHALGLATEASAPQARLRSCTGMTGCASGLADTAADARALAPLLGADTATVHLTGCAKSCAAASPLAYTLLARARGRYDLFSQDGAGPSRFGRLLASDIPIELAARRIHTERQP